MLGMEANSATRKYIPGYTGHIPSKEEVEQINNFESGFYIPGYAGFVKGIKSENMYGKTFGEATAVSKEGLYHKGHDLPPSLKLISSIQESYTDQMLAKKNYLFKFTRLTNEQQAKTKQFLKESRSRFPKPPLEASQGRTIDINFDEI